MTSTFGSFNFFQPNKHGNDLNNFSVCLIISLQQKMAADDEVEHRRDALLFYGVTWPT